MEKQECLWHILGIHLRWSESCFKSTSFCPLTVKSLAWSPQMYILTPAQTSPLLVTEHSGFIMTAEWAGSSVNMTGHHHSLNDVALQGKRPRSCPRQSLSQCLRSRDEGGGGELGTYMAQAGGLSFWQLSFHSTHTPVSIRKLTWGDQQPSMWLRTRPLTFQLNHKVWQNLTADLTCAQKGKIEEIFTVIMHLKCPWFSVLTMFTCVLSSPPTLHPTYTSLNLGSPKETHEKRRERNQSGWICNDLLPKQQNSWQQCGRIIPETPLRCRRW